MTSLVVIPVRNRPDAIVETLESVANQTRPPDQVVVIDDGSTDTTRQTITEWATQHALSLVIESQPHQGASAARNHGLKHAKASHRFVAFLDSDDIWPKDFLERTEKVLSQQTQAMAVTTDRAFFDPESDTVTNMDFSGIKTDPHRWILQHGAGFGSATLFRTAAVIEAGCYPEHFPTGHDAVLFGRIARLGKWAHATGAPVMMRRYRSQSQRGRTWHLYTQHPDYLIWRAKAGQTLWDEGPPDLRDDLLAREGLANRWALALGNAIRLKNWRLAFESLKRINQAIPLKPSTWSRRWRSIRGI